MVYRQLTMGFSISVLKWSNIMILKQDIVTKHGNKVIKKQQPSCFISITYIYIYIYRYIHIYIYIHICSLCAKYIYTRGCSNFDKYSSITEHVRAGNTSILYISLHIYMVNVCEYNWIYIYIYICKIIMYISNTHIYIRKDGYSSACLEDQLQRSHQRLWQRTASRALDEGALFGVGSEGELLRIEDILGTKHIQNRLWI